MKPAYIYCLRGQGGRVTSGGVDDMAAQMALWPNAKVQTFDWWQWQRVVADVNSHAAEDAVRLGLGYSLGANALTWVLGGVTSGGISAPGIRKCKFDFAAFIDPTWLSAITPLTRDTLASGIHFKNTSLDLVGHGDIPAPGVELVVVQTFESHMMVDYDKDVQQRILSLFMAART